MPESTTVKSVGSWLLVAAAFVVVVAGMRAAQPIVVPFLLAVFVAVLAAPPVFSLTKKGLPFWLSMLIVIGAGVAFAVFVSGLVGRSMSTFVSELPRYETLLQEKQEVVFTWLESMGFTELDDRLRELLDPGAGLRMAGGLLSQLGGVMANSFLILLTTCFLLVEASAIPKKIRQASDRPDETIGQLRACGEQVNRYMALKAIISLATGVIIAIYLGVLGVSFPILFGLLAFLLNFVPNLGSILAAVPAVLLAALQQGGGTAGLVVIGYVAVNVLVGSVLEPRILGRGLGLSTLVVFLSLVFWGWVLGPVGMLLSVPLTITVKIVLESNPGSRPIAVLLGTGEPASKQA